MATVKFEFDLELMGVEETTKLQNGINAFFAGYNGEYLKAETSETVKEEKSKPSSSNKGARKTSKAKTLKLSDLQKNLAEKLEEMDANGNEEGRKKIPKKLKELGAVNADGKPAVSSLDSEQYEEFNKFIEGL